MKFLLFISTLIFLTKTSYSDEKMLALGDKEYGQHLAGECVTCHKANSDKAGRLDNEQIASLALYFNSLK